MKKAERFKRMYLVMMAFWGIIALVCLFPSMPGFKAFTNYVEVSIDGVQK